MSAMSGGQAGYYLGLAREDYYLEGGEPPGVWFGQGAETLGLVGEVEPDHLYNLFDGLSPSGDRMLVQLQQHEGKAEHRPGWDLTFSAPKSVSVLWSQASDEIKKVIQEAHFWAVKESLSYLQDVAGLTRRGKGGRQMESAGLAVACFEHSTSRALDPQLHTHALVMNIGVREDGTTGTVSSLPLFLHKMTAGALYRAELSARLESDLGVEIERQKTWFEIAGVSKELVQFFSKRREAIEAEMSRRGVATAQGAAVAAIETRDAKEAISRAQLFEDWIRTGSEFGWSASQVERLLGSVIPARNKERELSETGILALAKITSEQAHFCEREFIRRVAEESQGRGIFAKDVRAKCSLDLQRSPDIIRLGLHGSEKRYTTKQMLLLEKSLLDKAEQMAENILHQVSPDIGVKILSVNGELSEEQMKAVWHIAVETGAVALSSGMAGTGKTRMLDVARQAWEAQGFTVLGAALAARAAGELGAGAMIRSTTIAKHLHEIANNRSEIKADTVLVVDEAGMVATPDLEKLVSFAQRVGAKLVLVGDERQLQPIGPGAPFMELGARFGRAELNDIRRQHDPWARQAVKDMADGNTKEAVNAFASRGLLKISETKYDAMTELIKSWRQADLPLKESLIIASTRLEVRELNRLAQDERKKDKEIEEQGIEFNDEIMHVGDRVIFTKNHKTLGVVNGERGTIVGISGDGERMSVSLDSGEKVSFETIAMPDISLGYAATTHKAQGATTKEAFVLVGGNMQDREISYVQASRARERTTLFMTRSEAGDDLAQLVKEMERSRQKEMAHTLTRLKHGLEDPQPS
ncbi:MAG: MobF family relaxase [Armatimonadota bacterium]